MATDESIQHVLDRVRPPRVQITYDVHIGDAVEKKELPLVVGILADLAGQPEKPLPRLKERKFVQIDRDNRDQVMEAIHPRVKLVVENKLKGDGGKMAVELRFKSLEDFSPFNIVQQVEPLRKLYETRQRLVDMLAKLDGNDELMALLAELTDDKAKLGEVKAQLAAKSTTK